MGKGFDDAETVQIVSDQFIEDRCFHLPSRRPGCNGLPPAEAFPDLTQPRRPYRLELERDIFDLQRVDAFLGQWRWQRVVDPSGKVYLGDRSHYVGKPYRRQVVKLRFEPGNRDVICSTVDGNEIKRLHVLDFSTDYILGTGGMT